METADADDKARKGEQGNTSAEAWKVPRGETLGGGLELVEWAMQTHTPQGECNAPSFPSWWLCW